MALESDDIFNRAIATLTRGGPHRVWSLIVTVFGDLAQGEGQDIAGPTLSRILAPMGVKAEAQRVALHRLRKDDWIDSRRDGRFSRHFLTAKGRAASAAAARRIYAAEPSSSPERWHLALAGPEPDQALSDLAKTGAAIAVDGRMLLGPGRAPAAAYGLKDALVLEADALSDPPEWLQAAFCPPDLVAAYGDLAAQLAELDSLTETWPAPGPDPLETAALRVLIVHDWRRLVLRRPDLPPNFFPAAAPIAACRAHVARLLARFPRPDLAAIG